jgi:glutamate-1-semialdehyde 2,1-aminomutase
VSVRPRSDAMFAEASTLFPGGVQSPVRAFHAVGGTPVFLERGAGAIVTGVDGEDYVDYVMSWGPLLLGHAHTAVVRAVSEAAARGLTFGTPNPLEIELARQVRRLMPNIDKLRFVGTGTEAVMSALRLARAATGRARVVKFAGGYHGHADSLLVRAGSGVATLGLPDSPGVPAEVAGATLVARYNDLDSVRTLFGAHGDTIASVVVEPVAGNMGVIPPEPGFLAGLRALTRARGALLVFDEVMTGFRVHPGGAQALYGIEPDLTVLGKILGGGLPVAAYGGRADLLDRMAPAGPVYQAGTLSGNPVAMAAGIATLTEIADGGSWERAALAAERVEALLVESARRHGVPVSVQRVGAMLTPFFRTEPARDWESAATQDVGAFRIWFHALLDAGVHWVPSPYEAAFPSAAHDEAVLSRTAKSFDHAFAAVAARGRREFTTPGGSWRSAR